ncbi:MAG: PP2C family protein-serine/threonine phosphatase [Anaerolineae bacterium]
MTNATILIVDDEPYNLDYLEQELEESGYGSMLAADGLQALEQVHAGHPDLILLDIMMPRMDGFQVLSILKADPATRDIPVIMISADTDLRSVVQGISLGADDYLPKPFEPVLLHARIASGLERKRLHDLEKAYRQGLEREMEIARQIQRSFLPAGLPEVAGWEIAACFRSAREVAGDFYDAFLLPNGQLALASGDVCGKGVGAALFMTLFRSLIRATLTSACFREEVLPLLTPAEALAQTIAFTNRYVVETHGDEGIFCALFVSVLDLATGRLAYANCGNDPPLLISNGTVRAELWPTGPVVGIFEQATFDVKELVLGRGDVLVAYTDGVIDALNEAGVAYGMEGLYATLAAGTGAHPLGARALVAEVETRVKAHVGSASPFDDITLIALGRTTA